jgi:hypothetical protein
VYTLAGMNADSARVSLLEAIKDLRQREAIYDSMLEKKASAWKLMGKWRNTLHASGCCKSTYLYSY